MNLRSQDFKSCVYTNSTTTAYFVDSLIICFKELFPLLVLKHLSLLCHPGENSFHSERLPKKPFICAVF